MKIMKAIISDTKDFIREVEIVKVAALVDTFHLKFTSQLLSAKNPDEKHTNFDMLIKLDELSVFKNLIEDMCSSVTP